MSQIEVQQGTTAIISFETLASENGARVNADALPTVAYVHVDGVVNDVLATAATVTQRQDSTPANITGYYQVAFATTTLSVDNDVDVTINATINGAPASIVKSALIIDRAASLPVIR